MLPSIHHALKFFSAFLIFKWDYWYYCWICTGSASCGRYKYSNRHLWLHWKDWSGWGWGRGLSFNGIIIIITVMRLLVVVVVFFKFIFVYLSASCIGFLITDLLLSLLYNLNTDLWPRKREIPILIYEHFELQNLLFSDMSISQINLYYYISEMSYDNDNILSTRFHYFDGFVKGLRS